MEKMVRRPDPKGIGDQTFLGVVLGEKKPASVMKQNDAEPLRLIVDGFSAELGVGDPSLALNGFRKDPLRVDEEQQRGSNGCSNERRDDLLKRDARCHQGDQLVVSDEAGDEERRGRDDSKRNHHLSTRAEQAGVVPEPGCCGCLRIEDILHVGKQIDEYEKNKGKSCQRGDEESEPDEEVSSTMWSNSEASVLHPMFKTIF